MNLRLERLATRFDALALRERVMTFAGVAVVFVFLMNALLVDPLAKRSRQLTQSVADQNSELGALQVQIKGLEQAGAVDVDNLNRARLQRAQEQLSQLESELALAQRGLVSAESMPALLQDVLRRHHGLQLVELRTLPVSPLINHPAADDKTAKPAGETLAPEANAAAVPERNLYKHGFEVTVQGSYPDFVQYLAQLEKLPVRMYWGKVTMNADAYPRVTLTATIYTLSLDKTWLAV